MVAALQLGIDVGGTFTDIVIRDAQGRLAGRKLATAAHDPAAVCRALLAEPAAGGAGQAHEIRYSTTAALNAILAGRLPPIGLIVTAGFRDLLETARYAPTESGQAAPHRLVALEHVRELSARCDAAGREVAPLVPAEVAAHADAFQRAGLTVVAVVLLHSYRNPAHEDAVADLLATQAPGLTVIRSSQVLPELREYERALATCLNACLVPVLGAHLDGFAEALARPGSALTLMQASGGLASARRARELPLATALSGPAAAVVGVRALTRSAALGDLITLDVGGTSTDVALLRDGDYALTTAGSVGGFPLRLPMIDVLSIGAGGGSLARVAPDGRWLVGPDSAGAVPGPVCYGQGGREVTLTDAQLVLGRLPPALLGGELALDRAAAARALAAFGSARGLDAAAAAHGLVAIASHAMCGAIRRVAARKGEDPTRLGLLAMGGAGPLHAAELAALLGVRRVVVPPQPGLAAAYGALSADASVDCVRGIGAAAAALAPADLEAIYAELSAAATARLAAEGWASAACRVEEQFDLRYAGMMHEWTVPALRGADGRLELAATLAAFERHFADTCGHRPREAVEVVNLRVRAIGRSAPPASIRAERAGLDDARPASREVWFLHDAGPRVSAVLPRAALGAGTRVAGPAVIEQHEATTLVPPGWSATVDTHGNLIIEPDGR